MSIFEYCRPVGEPTHRDMLTTLRQTLEQLEAEDDETPRISDLKRILAARIQAMKSKTD